jgi:hypothetical protein
VADVEVKFAALFAGLQTLSPPEREHWRLVERVASSETFSRAARLREILVYLARQALLHANSVKEHDIAVDVLSRACDFDGSVDNIVRVQVGHLRRKLEQYFDSEGKQEPILILIPKGSYAVRFEQRKSTPDESQPTQAETASTLPLEAPKAARRWRPAVVTFVLLGLFLAGETFALLNHLGRNPAAPVSHAFDGNPFVQKVFATTTPTFVVTNDANLQLIHTMLHIDVSISEYVAPNYPYNLIKPGLSPALAALLPSIATARYTSYGDANILLESAQMAQKTGGQAVSRYARFVNIRDFDHGNFILLGSKAGIPWVTLFEPKLNFIPETDPSTGRLQIRNRSPQKGEPAVYPVVGNWSSESTSYISIGLVPNLTNTGYVLLFSGTGMETTEAAATFLYQKNSTPIIRHFIPDNFDDRQPIELLLKVHSVLGAADRFEVVTARYKAR